MTGAEYDLNDGKITRVLDFPDHFDLPLPDGCGFIPCDATVNDESHYVLDGQICARPSLPLMENGSVPLVVTFDSLPSGTAVCVTNEAGDSLTFAAPCPPLRLTDAGTYTFDVLPPFPWKALSQKLEVQNA